MAKKLLQRNPCARIVKNIPSRKYSLDLPIKINDDGFRAARSNGELDFGHGPRTIHDPLFSQELDSQE